MKTLHMHRLRMQRKPDKARTRYASRLTSMEVLPPTTTIRAKTRKTDLEHLALTIRRHHRTSLTAKKIPSETTVALN